MPLTIHARNYHGLVDVQWTVPLGLSVVVGANGAGKTTLVFLLDILRRASSASGIAQALQDYGARQLRYLGAATDEPVVFGASFEGLEWSFEVFPEGGGVRAFPAEQLAHNGKRVFERTAGSPTFEWDGQQIATTDQRPIIRILADASLQTPFVAASLLHALSASTIYYDYDLRGLRRGSPEATHRSLSWAGSNAFSVLRGWRDRTAQHERYRFVVDSLKECFSFFEGIDFERGGEIIEAFVVPRKFPRETFPAAQVANGWLVALIHFIAVASADRGHIVAIDEFESALHPRALRNTLDLIDAYATAKGISVVVTTQSAQVLDWFDSRPEQVFVLDRGLRPGPRPLTELRSKEWLAHFRLGRVFADGDFGTETEG